MEADSFPREDVQRALSKMVTARVDNGSDPKSFKAHGGKLTPLFVLVDPSGKERGRCEGLITKDLLDALSTSLFNPGAQLDRAGKNLEAFEQMAMIPEFFPDTEAAKRTKLCMARWEGNPELSAKMAELRMKWRCEPALRAAERLVQQKATDPKKVEPARVELERIVADYGTSPYAAQAKELLAKLAPKKEPAK